MPSALLDPVAPLSFESLRRKRWTRTEIDELTSKGWFAGEHYELIDGELIDKMGKGVSHVFATMALFEWLLAVFGVKRIHKEDPIDVAAEDNEHNQPEPDLVVLREPILKKPARHPQPEDVLLAIEVSDTTLATDRSLKAALYARASIPEYWILDLKKRRLIVHRQPSEGQYASVVGYGEDESVAPLAAPESPFHVAAALGD
jgi:Uma2 family endonuclease